jgi:hypothetical protein
MKIKIYEKINWKYEGRTEVGKITALGGLILFAAGAKFAFDGIMNADGMLLDTTINVNETQLLTMILIAGLVSIFVEKRWMQGWALLITTVAAVIITADEAVIAILKSEEVSSLEKWLAAIFTIEAGVVGMSVLGALLSTRFFELVWENTSALVKMWAMLIIGLLYAYLEGLLSIQDSVDVTNIGVRLLFVLVVIGVILKLLPNKNGSD